MKIIFQSFYSRLCFLAIGMTGDQEEARDMAQDSLSIFWQQRQRFKDASLKEVSAFLFTIVRNRCFNYLRHRKVIDSKHQFLLDTTAGFEEVVESQLVKEDLYYRIYQEILQLPDAQQQLLKMIFVEDLSIDEIARRLGKTPNNVRNQKARALEKLRSILLKKRLSLAFLYFFINSL